MFKPMTFASDNDAIWRAGPPIPHPMS